MLVFSGHEHGLDIMIHIPLFHAVGDESCRSWLDHMCTGVRRLMSDRTAAQTIDVIYHCHSQKVLGTFNYKRDKLTGTILPGRRGKNAVGGN